MLVWVPGYIEEEDALDYWQEYMPDAAQCFLAEAFRECKLPASLIGENITVYCKLNDLNNEVYKAVYKVRMVPQAMQVSKLFEKVE